MNRTMRPRMIALMSVFLIGLSVAGCGKETNTVAEPPADWAPTPVGEDPEYDARMAAEMSGQMTPESSEN